MDIDDTSHRVETKGCQLEEGVSFGANANSYPLVRFSVDRICLPLTSLPWFCKNSTSCWVKVVMEMDLTLWGGLRPLLTHETTITNENI